MLTAGTGEVALVEAPLAAGADPERHDLDHTYATTYAYRDKHMWE